MSDLNKTVRANYSSVLNEIEEAAAVCGRDSNSVSVMAVTKTHPAEYIKAVLECGIRHIGENRVSEGGRKIKELGRDSAVFHAIGVLHRKEVRQAVRDFHCLDAVDRIVILEEIAKRGGTQEILLEVNTSGESAKKGFPPQDDLVEQALSCGLDLGLSIRGFLTVGPITSDLLTRRRAFSQLRELRDRVSQRMDIQLPVLSMGMSDDFAAAVLEGSTMVRLGRRLFGQRLR